MVLTANPGHKGSYMKMAASLRPVGSHSKSQASQEYLARPCFKNTKISKSSERIEVLKGWPLKEGGTMEFCSGVVL